LMVAVPCEPVGTEGDDGVGSEPLDVADQFVDAAVGIDVGESAIGVPELHPVVDAQDGERSTQLSATPPGESLGWPLDRVDRAVFAARRGDAHGRLYVA